GMQLCLDKLLLILRNRMRVRNNIKKFEVPETIEQRILEAAVPGEAIRFAVTAYTLGNADREAKSYDSSMVNVGDNSGGIANEVSILWHANFEEFIRHLRHKVFLLLLFSFMGQITTSVAEPVSQEASTDDEIFIYQSLIFDDGLKDLKNLRSQLYSAAEYFELSYPNDDQK
ncbi:hypothetical protein S83_063757, partial [Arachis hypogaea]